MRMRHYFAVFMLAGTAIVIAGDTTTDPAEKFAWAENVGWMNAGPTNCEVAVHFNGDTTGWLSGRAWGENVGWIKMGADAGGPYANSGPIDWGVNMSTNGDLSGYAWGENIGWINFGHSWCDVCLDPVNGEFSGHAWSENAGWIKLRGTAPDYGVRNRSFDTQPQGTPNWWLALHGVDEDYDAGDGVPAWRKYVMDTDPNTTGNCLRITALSFSDGTRVHFQPASARRYYTLVRRENLVHGAWSNVAGQVGMEGEAGEQSLRDTNPPSPGYYSVKVSTDP